MTGAELKAARRRTGLSQTAMGARVGVTRGSVSLWERKARVNLRECTPRRMLVVLDEFGELPTQFQSNARARGGVLSHRWTALLEREARQFAEEWARSEARLAALNAMRRVPCEARTRKGHPCRALSEPGRRRCRFHGGRSTGPRTPEGRARIAEAQRRRWARWRAEHKAGEAAAPRPLTGP